MTDDCTWYFPTDDSDEPAGFNDSGINTFNGNPIRHLAREISQNALDAGNGGTVEVKFKKRKVKTSSIPNFTELQDTFIRCKKRAKQDSEKSEAFFKKAVSLLTQKTITVLEISDYNTIGIEGPCDYGTPFHAFMKASGQSRKSSDTATGSYGIGKYAPYSTSKIRTILVSTTCKMDGTLEQLTQGKAILISHDQEGQLKRGTGYWGIKEKCKPYVGISNKIPGWIQRENPESDIPKFQGSKISIICFDDQENWRELLSVHIAKNFFGAINEEKLSVDIDGIYVLNKANLQSFFEDDSILSSLEDYDDALTDFSVSKDYFQALQETDEVIVCQTESRLLGRCEVKILLGENLPKKACILRNGMFILEDLKGLMRFPDFKDFIAVIECKNDKGNAFLRSMEPPRHDKFEPDLLTNDKDRKKGRKALSELAKWVRKELKKNARDPVSDVTTIDELSEYFGEDDEGRSGEGSEELNPFGKVVITPRRVKQKTGQAKKAEGGPEGTGDGSGGGGTKTGKGGGNGDKTGGTGSGEGGSGGGSKKTFINLNNIRATILDPKKRNLSFTPVSTGKIGLKAFQVGADADFDIAVTDSSLGTIEKGIVELDVKSGKRQNITITLNNDFFGALKVVAYEI